MKFHGLVDENLENIKSRNLRQLVRKVRNYKTFLEENTRYETEFLDVGDGLAVSKKRY
jgi:predicted O-methyltransferase YrrM